MPDKNQTITLLHLSDMQFGLNHRFGMDAESLLNHLRDDLELLQKDHDLRPNLLALTGDLTEEGLKSEFKQVMLFVSGLTEYLDLTAERVIIVPGNHDVNRLACESYATQCKADETSPCEPYWPKWKHFSNFFNEFYQETEHRFTDKSHWNLFEIPELKLVAAGLNSTIKEKYLGENHPENVHCGWLGKEQCDWFKECLDDYKKQGWLRIAALHHNVKRRAAYDEENLKDADQFEEILGDSLNLVLHGHTHEGKQEWLGHSAPVPVLATGSIALKDQALADAPNQYQIIRIAENQFSRWCRQFAKDKNGWIGDNRASPKGDNWHHNISVTLDSASNTFAESDIANHFDLPSKERPDDDTFIARVEEVCRLHNPDAEITRYSHQHLPYLRVGAKEGGFVHTYPLGVAKHGITQEMLDKFSRQVADKYRSGDSRLISYLVYEGERASEKLIRYARRLRICLQSFIEYQGLIDFRHYLERQTEKLRNDPVYPPESLLHLSINSQPPHATDFVD